MGSSSQVDDSITRKYDIKRRIGKGAYGIVWKAVDRSTNRPVAVKKIFDAFCNSTDAQRTFREIMFLQEFRNHPNVVKLLNIHRASNDKDIYLVFEFMETDLHKVIKRKHILQDLHKRFIMYQLLRATYYIHSGNVIHRDQKPSNILLDSYCRCKIADFGLARSLASESAEGVSTTDPALTDYVATRWYRAPEILVASKQYTKGIDMWSLGCILAEMLLGKPLFPGSSTINQVEKIMATIDPPTPTDLARVCPGYGSSLFTRAPAGPRLPLTEVLRGAAPEGVDLVCRLLVLNPFKRLTAEQALEHPYVARFRRKGREPALGRCIVPALSDDVQLSVGEYRTKLYEMYDGRSPSSGSAGSSSSSASNTSSGSKKQPPKAPLAAQGGGDGSAVAVSSHHGVRNRKSNGGAAKSKSDGSGGSGGTSAPLSTPPLRKPTRPPRDSDGPPKRRQTRHLSSEDVRARLQLHQPHQPHQPRHQHGGAAGRTAEHHLLPRRLSVSEPAVTASRGRQPRRLVQRRSCHEQLEAPAAPSGLRGGRAARGSRHAPAAPAAPGAPGAPAAPAAPQLALGSALSAALGPLGARSSGSLSRLQQQQQQQPQCRDSSHSIRTSHHAYFNNYPSKQSQRLRPGSGQGGQGPSLLGAQTVGNIGFITASGLSELRPGYRWQR